jgi:hypothetical protein
MGPEAEPPHRYTSSSAGLFSRWRAIVQPGATALIFFSGFGIQARRKTYMIPVNAQIWSEDDVRRNVDSVYYRQQWGKLTDDDLDVVEGKRVGLSPPPVSVLSSSCFAYIAPAMQPP